MARYRKKPAIIEAQQFEPQRLGEALRDFERRAVEVARWCGGRLDFGTGPRWSAGVPVTPAPALDRLAILVRFTDRTVPAATYEPEA